MKNFYEVGKVYIWQNVKTFPELNGTETTVTGDVCLKQFGFFADFTQMTDTVCFDGRLMCAPRGYLRPKNPPPGEQSIRDLFKLPNLEPA